MKYCVHYEIIVLIVFANEFLALMCVIIGWGRIYEVAEEGVG